MRKQIALVLVLSLAALLVLWVRSDYHAYAARTNASAAWGYAVTRLFQWSNASTDVVFDTRELKDLARKPDHKRGYLTGARFFNRIGPRPRMVRGVPHRQLDQHPSAEMRRYVKERLATLEDVRSTEHRVAFRASVWELTGASALIIENCSDRNCQAAAQRSKGEFAHLHSHDGSAHMLLAVPDLIKVIDHGWGELFPLSGRLGGTIPHVALVYAPRTVTEFITFRQILRASFLYAGTPNKPAMGGSAPSTPPGKPAPGNTAPEQAPEKKK